LIALPETALLDAGYLKRLCTESINYHCPDDGGDLERDGRDQFVCTICLRVVRPILRCERCKEVFSSEANVSEGRERACLSALAYDKGKGHLPPAFAPNGEILWAFRTSAYAPIQIATETELRNKFAHAELPETTEVSSPQRGDFVRAQITAEFSEALSARRPLVAESETGASLNARGASEGGYLSSLRALQLFDGPWALVQMALMLSATMLVMGMLLSNIDAFLHGFSSVKYNFFVILVILLSFGFYLYKKDLSGKPKTRDDIIISIFFFVFFFFNLLTFVQSRNPYILFDMFDRNIFRVNVITFGVLLAYSNFSKNRLLSKVTTGSGYIFAISSIYLAIICWPTNLIVDPKMNFLVCLRFLLNL
jgi:hypothetical protein